MATHPALSLVAQAIVALLDATTKPAGIATVDNAVLGTSMLATAPPTIGAPPAIGVTVFPYRVSYNAQRRPTAPRLGPSGERFRASILLDLHFLISAWGAVDQQMRLLAWAARAIEDEPSLPASFLNRQGTGEQVFEANETVEVVSEPLSLQDLVAIWEVNKARQQPSLGYVARMIRIDSEVRVTDGPMVRSRTFDTGFLVEAPASGGGDGS